MYCNHCGKPVAEEARLCVHCGRAIIVVRECPHKLRRSRSNRRIAGVCGGIAEFFWSQPRYRAYRLVAPRACVWMRRGGLCHSVDCYSESSASFECASEFAAWPLQARRLAAELLRTTSQRWRLARGSRWGTSISTFSYIIQGGLCTAITAEK